MSLTWQEQQLIQDIEDGVGAAISELGFDINNLTSIKLNKLVYIAICEFYEDSPITYSWFKYGPSVGHQHVNTDSVDIRPLEEISDQEARVGQSGEYRSPEEYAYLYLKDIDYIEEILKDETKNYLKTFYRDYASKQQERYEQLYVRSIDLQTYIDDIYNNGLSPSNEYYENIDQAISGVGKEILSLEEVDESADPFTLYSDLLRDLILTCEMEHGELSEAQSLVLKQAIEFYYSHAWRFTMLMVSEETAVGPSRRDLIKATINDIESLGNQFATDLAMLRDRCLDRGLIAEEFTIDSDWERQLEIGYTENDKTNEEIVSSWEIASKEAAEYL